MEYILSKIRSRPSPTPVRPLSCTTDDDDDFVQASGKSGSILGGKSSNNSLNASASSTAAATSSSSAAGTAPKVDYIAGSAVLPDVVTNIKENHNDSLSNCFQNLAVQTGDKVDARRLLTVPQSAANSGSHTSSDDEAFVECDSFADESALLNGDTVYIGSHEDLDALLDDTDLLADTRQILTPAVSEESIDVAVNRTVDTAGPLTVGSSIDETATDTLGDSSLFRTFGDGTVVLNDQLLNATVGQPLNQTVVMDEAVGQKDWQEPAEQWRRQSIPLDQTAIVNGRCDNDEDAADVTIDVGAAANQTVDIGQLDQTVDIAGAAVDANSTLDIGQLDRTVDAGCAALSDETIDIDTAAASEAKDRTVECEQLDQTVDVAASAASAGQLDQTVDVAASAASAGQLDQTVDVVASAASDVQLDQTVDVAASAASDVQLDQTVDVAASAASHVQLDQTVDVAPALAAQHVSNGDEISATNDHIVPSYETDAMIQSGSIDRDGAFQFDPMIPNPFDADDRVQFDTMYADTPPVAELQQHAAAAAVFADVGDATASIAAAVDGNAATVATAPTDDYYDQFDVSMQEIPCATTDFAAPVEQPLYDEKPVAIVPALQFLPADDDDEAMDFDDDEDLGGVVGVEQQQQQPQQVLQSDDFGLPPPDDHPPPFQQHQHKLDEQSVGSVPAPANVFQSLAAANNNAAVNAEDPDDEQQFEGNNIILQSDDFDFLLSRGTNNSRQNNNAAVAAASTANNTASVSANRRTTNIHRVRESLLLRFDPLQQGRPSITGGAHVTNTGNAFQHQHSQRPPSNYQQLLGLVADDVNDNEQPLPPPPPPSTATTTTTTSSATPSDASPANGSMHESAGATASSELDAYCLSETLPQTSTADQSNDQLTPLPPPPPPPASPSDHGEDDDEEEEEEVFASASDEVIGEAAAAGTTPPVSPILPAASTPAVRLAGRAQRTAATAASPATGHSRMSVGIIQDMKTADSDVKSSIVSSNNLLINIKQEKIDAVIDTSNLPPLFSSQGQAPRMAELEYQLQTELLKSEDVEKKMREAEQREETYVRRISEKDKTIAKMNGVMEAYEKAIAELVAEKEHIIKTYELQNAELKNDRDANFQHLTSLESTFSDLHAKYERSKQTTSQLKELELKLNADNAKYTDLLKAQEQRYEAMKQHAIAQLEIANNKLDVMTRTHHTDNAKLRLNLKREEITRTAMQDQLNQKCKENQELLKICDELISGQGS